MKPKYLTDIIVLTTRQKGGESSDFFEKMEPILTGKMKEMAIDDLVNLLWSALQISKGSKFFYERLEEEIGRRVRGVKDEEFETLIACFAGEQQQAFSDKFMKLIVSVLNEKRDRFELATIVKVIWAFAKIDFNSDSYNTLSVLKEFAGYERLIANLPVMPQKS